VIFFNSGIQLNIVPILCVFGGLVGVVLSVAAGLIMNQLILDDALAVFTPKKLFYIFVAFGFAVVASILSGLYPAWKAASEQLIDGLRSKFSSYQ